MANCRAHRGCGRNEQISGNELRPRLAHYERRRNFYVRACRCFTRALSTLLVSRSLVLLHPFHVSLHPTWTRNDVATPRRFEVPARILLVAQ